MFNFEGGCYAKTIRLSQEWEPLIWSATRHFGCILENVFIDANTRRIDFDDASYTENTRAGYPIGFLSNIEPSGMAGHPQHDLLPDGRCLRGAAAHRPPDARPGHVSLHLRLHRQAGRHRKGAGQRAAGHLLFLLWGAFPAAAHRGVYADLLGEKLQHHDAQVWLVNTGWTGGPYGVGKRIDLPYTRALVHAALRGELDNCPMRTDPYFGFEVPEECPGVPVAHPGPAPDLGRSAGL